MGSTVFFQVWEFAINRNDVAASIFLSCIIEDVSLFKTCKYRSPISNHLPQVIFGKWPRSHKGQVWKFAINRNDVAASMLLSYLMEDMSLYKPHQYEGQMSSRFRHMNFRNAGNVEKWRSCGLKTSLTVDLASYIVTTSLWRHHFDKITSYFDWTGSCFYWKVSSKSSYDDVSGVYGIENVNFFYQVWNFAINQNDVVASIFLSLVAEGMSLYKTCKNRSPISNHLPQVIFAKCTRSQKDQVWKFAKNRNDVVTSMFPLCVVEGMSL
jgi:hypothetical protein